MGALRGQHADLSRVIIADWGGVLCIDICGATRSSDQSA